MKDTLIKLSETILGDIVPNEIIYAEITDGGGIILYLIKDNQFICYETNASSDEKVFILTQSLILKHQDVLNDGSLKKGELIFDFYYGGLGNSAFINKNMTLEISENYFVYKKDGIDYEILTSCLGVFNDVVHGMKNPNR